MKNYLPFLIVFSFLSLAGIASCDSQQGNTSEYVGKTFNTASDLGLYDWAGVSLHRGEGVIGGEGRNFSLHIMKEKPDSGNEGTYFFISEWNDGVKTIVAEMDFDRNTTDGYNYEEFVYPKDGSYPKEGFVVRWKRDGTIKEVYVIDLDNFKLIPTKPNEEMYLEMP